MPQLITDQIESKVVMHNDIDLSQLTPVEKHDDIWLKRDDLFEIAGVRGGKVRTCYELAVRALRDKKKTLVTVGTRLSPQIEIVAHIAKYLGLHCRAHTTLGEYSTELKCAAELGAEIVQHPMGFNNVLSYYAKEDVSTDKSASLIPFGMKSEEAITQTRRQVANVPKECLRIVVPVGSGMSLAGILYGLEDFNIKKPVIGILIGGNVKSTMKQFAPLFWWQSVTFIDDGLPYKQLVDAHVNGCELDPIYEAKALSFVKPGDLFWCVGIRKARMNWSKNETIDTTSSTQRVLRRSKWTKRS